MFYSPLLSLLPIPPSLSTNSYASSSGEEKNEVISDGRAVVSGVGLFDDRVRIVSCLYRD